MMAKPTSLLSTLLLVLLHSFTRASDPPVVDYSCYTCGDCAVKNVGNCCGHYPKCVSRHSDPDYEGMQQWCEDTGTAGDCGYEEVDICTCEEGVCQGYSSLNNPEVEQCQVEPPAVDDSCNTCGDCAVKNVGSCCGYYPKCVNRNSDPDYEGMLQWCKDMGVEGICGFEEVDICTCEEGICQGYASVNNPEVEQCSNAGESSAYSYGTMAFSALFSFYCL